MKRASTGHLLVVPLLMAHLCGCQPRTVEPTPPEAIDSGVADTAVAAGFDEAKLEQLIADIESGRYTNTHALLVEHDGVLVLERYFSGTDERWGEDLGERHFGPDSLHDLRSVSKSVTSVLLGIALGSDLEQAVERPVGDYLPHLRLDEAHRGITLHHVLTMTAGLEWNEMTVPYTDPTNDEIRTYDAEDPAEYVLSRPLAAEPGSTWYYSGGLSQMLASVITELTGQSVDEYARTHLFEPLEITEWEWLGPGSWTPDNPAAMSGLRLRPRDMAKIGSVFLHGGRWQGRQIVPEEWVELSSTRFVPEIGEWSDGGIWGYGYQWWIGDLPTGERVVAGRGNGNQRLFVLPEERLVVTVMAGQYNRFADHSERILERVLTARRVAPSSEQVGGP